MLSVWWDKRILRWVELQSYLLHFGKQLSSLLAYMYNPPLPFTHPGKLVNKRWLARVHDCLLMLYMCLVSLGWSWYQILNFKNVDTINTERCPMLASSINAFWYCMWPSTTELNNVYPCVRLWCGKQILCCLHVSFCVLLLRHVCPSSRNVLLKTSIS